MNRREKILGISVAGVVACLAVVVGVRAIILKPLQELDKRTAVVRDKIGKIQADRRAYFAAEDRLKKLTQRTFADLV